MMSTKRNRPGTKVFLWIVLPLVLMVVMTMAAVSGGLDKNKEGDFLLSPRMTFNHYCSACHGIAGKGDGRYYATSLTPKPADLTAKRISERGDEYLFKWISRGSVAMGRSNLCPPWGRTIQENHIRGIIVYLRTLYQESND